MKTLKNIGIGTLIVRGVGPVLKGGACDIDDDEVESFEQSNAGMIKAGLVEIVDHIEGERPRAERIAEKREEAHASFQLEAEERNAEIQKILEADSKKIESAKKAKADAKRAAVSEKAERAERPVVERKSKSKGNA